VANVDDLDEYYEFTTSVPSEWQSTDTIWFVEANPAEGNEPEQLRLEPPMLLNLKVPEDEVIQSISGIDYSGKSVVLQFADGIDIYNSVGFPMWCLNRETGQNKEPFVDDYGMTSCVNYTAMNEAMDAHYNADSSASMGAGYYDAPTTDEEVTNIETKSDEMDPEAAPYDEANVDGSSSQGGDSTYQEPFDWSEWQYELFPDILPELHWEGHDGLTRKWGLKPAEKTLIYVEIGEGNCTQDFENPITLESDDYGQTIPYLEEGGEVMRAGLTDLIPWYRENKDDTSFLRVHTGKLVGEALALATNGTAGEESGSG